MKKIIFIIFAILLVLVIVHRYDSRYTVEIKQKIRIESHNMVSYDPVIQMYKYHKFPTKYFFILSNNQRIDVDSATYFSNNKGDKMTINY